MKKISVLLIALVIVFFMTNITTYAASSDIEGPSVIHKEINQVFTIGDLLSLYDYDVFIETDNFTGYGNIPGEYQVILNQGNNTKTVYINVIEKWNKLERSNDLLFVSDLKDIYVSNERMLTLYEILYYIYPSTGYVEQSYQFRYEEISNTYHIQEFNDDGKIPVGLYDLSFRLTYYSGYQQTYFAHIITKEIIVNGIIIEAPPTTIEIIFSYLPWLICAGIVFYILKHRKKRGFNYD